MPNTDKLLKQSNAGFKRYTGIHKATFYEMLEAMKHKRPNQVDQACLVLSNRYYWHLLIGVNTERCTTSVWTLVFMSILLAVLFEK